MLLHRLAHGNERYPASTGEQASTGKTLVAVLQSIKRSQTTNNYPLCACETHAARTAQNHNIHWPDGVPEGPSPAPYLHPPAPVLLLMTVTPLADVHQSMLRELLLLDATD